ncbi:MAG: translation elongation factor 4 [Planctomycetota bacterium]
MQLQNIRNFCIIAHIDHGKSTLADRLLQLTGAVSSREFRDQFLDAHEIERERGITIKAKAVVLKYQYQNQEYLLNLIDTPGHVDFSYEVLRSLKACEGALLLVDATQGVQAQTMANTILAREAHLKIIPVINKIDLPTAHPDEVTEEMQNSLGIAAGEIIRVSAKEGTNVSAILEAVVEKIPPPQGNSGGPPQGLIFDSVYDEYRGVIIYVRMINGAIKRDDEVVMLNTNRICKVEEVGKFNPRMFPVEKLTAGEVGYIIGGIKNIRDIKIGDTITLNSTRESVSPLPGYREPLPMVYCGFYPSIDSDFKELKKAVERLSLNDSSFSYEPETSEALGFGFRCGFLGLLHMEIIQERLERDEGVSVIQTAPTVTYEVLFKEANETKTIRVDNPAKLPDESKLVELREPLVRLSLIIPTESIGQIMQLCENRRGKVVRTEYISPQRVILTYDMPLSEIIFDFYDKLKSITHGFGTMDYVFMGYQTEDLVKLRILVADLEVDAFSTIVHHSRAEALGRQIITILRKEIPRHLFQVALQASIGKRIIARENIKPLGKNVTSRCSGGDITRKRKLWDKQKAGKRKLKNVGRVEIPQEVFLSVLSRRES